MEFGSFTDGLVEAKKRTGMIVNSGAALYI